MLFNLLFAYILLGGNALGQVPPAPVDPATLPNTPPAEVDDDTYKPPPSIHYVIERRGGSFAPNWTANLPYLAEQLKIAESRFNFTRREVKGNKIIRVPKERVLGGGQIGKLIGEFQRPGNWYARMRIGTPAQKIQLDVDMLTRDFSVTTTSSSLGSRFEDFFSTTYHPNQLQIHPFPNCDLPADNIVLPTVNRTHGISFAHCKPRRQSRDTLLPSGAIFGLAPSTSLSQMEAGVPTFITQLVEGGFIKEEVFSITLISSEHGILTLGGTIQEQIETVENRIEGFLDKPGAQHPIPNPAAELSSPNKPPPAPGKGDKPGGAAEKKDKTMLEKVMEQPLSSDHDEQPAPDDFSNLQKREETGAQKVPTFEDLNPFNRAGRMKQKGVHLPSWKDGWKWSPVEGAAGWWQILLRGIWADQVKVMKNQPCIIDINTPFILAPPLAAKAFYASISGSYRLPAPYSNFYAYPCNNPPYLHFEFGGWRFPVMRGTKSAAEHRGANGKFSLGKVSDDSGYCVGAVVETRMGVGDAAPVKRGGNGDQRFNVGYESGMLAGNGLRDVWVLGEPVFRGMGLVFDMKTKEVGFRTY